MGFPDVDNYLGCLEPKQVLHCWDESSQYLAGILDLVNVKSVLTYQYATLVIFFSSFFKDIWQRQGT